MTQPASPTPAPPTPPPPAKINGGKIVIEALKAEGVDTVFGIISIHMLPIYDALRADPSIRLVIPRHEMAAGFMADAYSRVTGKTGVYLTSTGPGAANSMGAVIESWGASSRTLQITSQIHTHLIPQRKGMLHEVKDQAGMFAATGAQTAHAAKTAQIAPAIRKAMHALRERRPTPQVVEIPIDQQYGMADGTIESPLPVTPLAPNDAALDRAADMLCESKRPVLWLGGGANNSGAHLEILRLAEFLGPAIFTTRGGRGAISDEHPMVIGNYFGERAARAFLGGADCVIAVGTKFSWHSTSEWGLTLPPNLIRVDIDPQEMNHNYPAAISINSDATLALKGLADRLEARRRRPLPHYLETIAEARTELREEFKKHRPKTAELMDAIDAAAPKNRILATDATIPAYWGANQYLPVRVERGFVTPRLAAIGPGYPLALGAQAAYPGHPVICIAGDGGWVMHEAELSTAVQEKLPVVLMIFNNRGYGVLKKLQEKMMGGRVFAVDLHTPDFVKIAEGHGVAGEAAKTPGELRKAVERGFAAGAPYMIDVQAEFEG